MTDPDYEHLKSTIDSGLFMLAFCQARVTQDPDFELTHEESVRTFGSLSPAERNQGMTAMFYALLDIHTQETMSSRPETIEKLRAYFLDLLSYTNPPSAEE